MTGLEVAWHVSPRPLRDEIMAGGVRPDPDFDGPDLWLWSSEARAREWASDVTYGDADVWRVDLRGVPHEHLTYIDHAEDVQVPGGVDRLFGRVPRSVDPTPADVERGVAELELALPDGYLSVARAYGPGTFAGEIHLYVPGSSHLAFDVLDWTREWTETNRLRLEDPWSARRWKHALWPEPGGLVAWGHFAEAACLWWDTSDPDPNGGPP